MEGIIRLRRNRLQYMKYKEHARALVMASIFQFNEHYRLPIGRVSIKNQKRCWGSCSRKGNLNFNYALVLLPLSIAQYVVVHEMCHLVHFNHSKAFWDLVAQTMPEYRSLRAQLMRYRRG